MLELDNMTEYPPEEIVDLFIQIRHHLVGISQNDPETTKEIYRLVYRLEDWIDLLIIDSIKLRTLEKKLKDMFDLVRRIGITEG